MSGLKDTTIIFSSKMLNNIIAIGTSSMLAWILGPEGRGTLAISFIFLSLIKVIFSFGLDNSIQYYSASTKIKKETLLYYILIFICCYGLFGVVTSYFLIKLPISFFQKAPIEYFKYMVFYLPISLFDSTMYLFFLGAKKFKIASIIIVTNNLLKFLLLVIFIVIKDFYILGVIYAHIIAGICSGIMYLSAYFYNYKLQRFDIKIQNVTRIFKYGIKYYFAKLSNLANVKVGTILITFFTDNANIGIFTVASRFLTRIFIIPDSLISIILPKVAKSKDGEGKLVIQMARTSMYICFLFLMICLLFSKTIISILFSPEFSHARILMFYLAPGILIRSFSKILMPYFNGINKPQINSLSTFLGTVTNLIMIIILLPLFGLKGAAIAMSIGYFTSSFFLLKKFFQFNNKFKLTDCFILKISDMKFVKKEIIRFKKGIK